jgi:hypothetical protein
VLGRHLTSTAHSPSTNLFTLLCHVLQMAIVSTSCDAYSPVCLLYQLVPHLFFFFFFFSFKFLFFFFYNTQLPRQLLLSSIRSLQHHGIWTSGRKPAVQTVPSLGIRQYQPSASSASQNNPVELLGEPTTHRRRLYQGASPLQLFSHSIPEPHSIHTVISRVFGILTNSLELLTPHPIDRRRQARHGSSNHRPVSRASRASRSDTKHQAEGLTASHAGLAIPFPRPPETSTRRRQR